MPTSEEAASTFSGTDFRQLAYLWENDLNYFPKILAELSIFETTLKKVAATGDKTATLPSFHQREKENSLVANLARTQLRTQERAFLSSYNYRIIKAAFQEPHFIKVKDSAPGSVPSTAELDKLSKIYAASDTALIEEAQRTPAIQLKALQDRDSFYKAKSKSIATQLLSIVSAPEINNLKPLQGEQYEAYVKRVHSHTPQIRSKFFKTRVTPKKIQTRFSGESLSEPASRYLADQSMGMPEISTHFGNNPPDRWDNPAAINNPDLNETRTDLSKNLNINSFMNKIKERESLKEIEIKERVRPEPPVTDSGEGGTKKPSWGVKGKVGGGWVEKRPVEPPWPHGTKIEPRSRPPKPHPHY